jgi:two-component system cell cycle sensor histidine kinase/response regulator CckA
MGGRELVDNLKRTRTRTKILFTSGYTDDEALRHGIEHENVAFLQKPFSAQQLAKRVGDALDLAHA